jgi:hypothetical protein
MEMENKTQATSQEQVAIRPKAKARRGGESYRCWNCCICDYVNKTGKFEICSNPKQENCCGKFSAEEQRERPKADFFLNHRRCDNCRPYYQVDFEEGHNRRWQDEMGVFEVDDVKATASRHHDWATVLDFQEEIDNLDFGSRHFVQRDPLTYQRVNKDKLDPRTSLRLSSVSEKGKTDDR